MSRAHLIQEAVRTGRKARIALDGPTGSGKTWTALQIATALVGEDGKIAVIDTERNSACLYSDQFKFDAIDWRPPYSPVELAEDIKSLSKEYDAVICDSLTHFYKAEGGTLDIVDAASARARGNSFAGWKVGTPAQDGLVEAILQADSHVIVTMRSKMEYVLEEGPNGKQVPKKIGMAPEQRAGIEYEFTVIGDLDMEHRLIITKSRCSAVADQMYQPGRSNQMGQTMREWLEGAVEAEKPSPTPDNVVAIGGGTDVTGYTTEFTQEQRKEMNAWWKANMKGASPKSVPDGLIDKVLDKLEEMEIAADTTATSSEDAVTSVGKVEDGTGSDSDTTDDPDDDPEPPDKGTAKTEGDSDGGGESQNDEPVAAETPKNGETVKGQSESTALNTESTVEGQTATALNTEPPVKVETPPVSPALKAHPELGGKPAELLRVISRDKKIDPPVRDRIAADLFGKTKKVGDMSNVEKLALADAIALHEPDEASASGGDAVDKLAEAFGEVEVVEEA